MKYRYDAEADVLLIRLREGRPEYGEQKGDVITHYGKDRRAVEIEILDASQNTADLVRTVLTAQRKRLPARA
jgi:uncharacterized protein YuzE